VTKALIVQPLLSTPDRQIAGRATFALRVIEKKLDNF
jgi:hypothetical protein